jgi:hypothetical protein
MSSVVVSSQTSSVPPSPDMKPLEAKFLRVSLESCSTQASYIEAPEMDFKAAMMQFDAEFESPCTQPFDPRRFAVGTKQSPRKRARSEDFAQAVMELDAEFDQ